MSTAVNKWSRRVVLLAIVSLTGCAHIGRHQCGTAESCESCGTGQCEGDSCASCGECESGGGCCHGGHLAGCLYGWCWRKSNAIPDTLPLGSTVRSHLQVMETNAEAADFILHRHDFVGQTAELTPNAKDHILEIAARMRSTPFPVIVERSDNNSDPELDAIRRNLVAQILTDLGNPDAQQRTVVAPSYGPGYVGERAEMTYYQHIYRGGLGGGNLGGGFGGGGVGFF